MINKGIKSYILIAITSIFLFTANAQVVDFIIRHIAGNDSNVKTVGLTIFGATIFEGIPGLIGPKFNQMEECINKYEDLNPSDSDFIIIDTNDYCNTIAYLNDKSGRLVSSGYDYDKAVNNMAPGIIGLGNIFEGTTAKLSEGLITNSAYMAAHTFKDVPLLKNTFAQTDFLDPAEATDNLVEQVRVVWNLTRNIAFVILLIAALITGISIMSSKALSGKDTDAKIITAEKALPRVVLAVILISSSYYIGDLTVRTLLGSGLTTGIAKFTAASFLTEGSQAEKLDIPLPLLFYAAIANFVNSPVAVVIALLQVVGFFTAWIRLQLHILGNLFLAILYIIAAPLIIAQGALPSDMSGEAFKRYAYSLMYYVGCGFMFSLVSFLAKAILIMFSTNTGIIDPLIQAAGGSTIASIILQIFYPVACIFILWQAKKVQEVAAGLAARVTGVKDGFLSPVAKSASTSSK